MKRFKKAYVEITNVCNFNCSFCASSNRVKTVMPADKFKIAAEKLAPYTDYLYFHLLGEPLTHPQINEIAEIAFAKKFYTNLTTNGVFLSALSPQNAARLRKITFSLHSLCDVNNRLDCVTVLQQIAEFIHDYPDVIKELRFWADTDGEKILGMLEKLTGLDLTDADACRQKRIYVKKGGKFDWPAEGAKGSMTSCYALRDQIGLLSDGTVVPCCLDCEGKLALGNIFEDDLEEMLNGDVATRLRRGFDGGAAVFPLCKGCSFLQKRGT